MVHSVDESSRMRSKRSVSNRCPVSEYVVRKRTFSSAAALWLGWLRSASPRKTAVFCRHFDRDDWRSDCLQEKQHFDIAHGVSMNDLKMYSALALALFVPAVSLVLHAQSIEINPQTILEVHNVITKPVVYRGKSAMEIRDAAPQLG